MFASRYFAPRYYPPRYFPNLGAEAAQQAQNLSNAGGGGKKKKRGQYFGRGHWLEEFTKAGLIKPVPLQETQSAPEDSPPPASPPGVSPSTPARSASLAQATDVAMAPLTPSQIEKTKKELAETPQPQRAPILYDTELILLLYAA